MPPQLYQPYDPRLKHEIIYQKRFHEDSIHFSLRPFLIPGDFELYNKWITAEVNKEKRIHSDVPLITEDYFEAIALSSRTLCMCGLINDSPCFVLEVFPALIHCPTNYVERIKPTDRDVLLQLLIAPGVIPDPRVRGYILDGCLHYLSGFHGLKWTFWILDNDNYWYQSLAAQTGVLIELGEGKRGYKYDLSRFG
jgi:hypothetical protein